MPPLCLLRYLVRLTEEDYEDALCPLARIVPHLISTLLFLFCCFAQDVARMLPERVKETTELRNKIDKISLGLCGSGTNDNNGDGDGGGKTGTAESSAERKAAGAGTLFSTGRFLLFEQRQVLVRCLQQGIYFMLEGTITIKCTRGITERL